ncbi:MAG: M3 family oligoendopeptidase [Tissierellales bacterium]|jgi:M3 family oligoendopeptidase|nr:M3 family oligoendopeptidase [Tissierellales bacterium]
MKFSEFEYKRPDLDAFKAEFKKEIDMFEKAESASAQNEALKSIVKVRNTFLTQAEIAGIRYSINTKDSFYEAEQDFFDGAMPEYEGLVSNFYKALIKSQYRDELEEKWGKLLFDMAELQIKTYSDDILEDLKVENQLSSKYTKLLASAEIEYDGKVYNIPQMRPFMMSKNREERKIAADLVAGFFAENESKFDEIYDEMVKIRHNIAKKLGYDNFVELGYDRLGRTDYNSKSVSVYRSAIEKYVVPIAESLRSKQATRLGLDALKYYDLNISFNSGNATPKGTPEQILEAGRKMYHELSKETGEFFDFMMENELMDVLSKDGKSPGGYCTFINDYKSPFIFSNFNGTADDVDVLTHEAGHAFQVYMSRDYELPEYVWPTLEACEIHSMSMEFLTHPWMNLFFEEDAEKYYFNHVNDAFTFLPYGVTVDDFQHFVYENPNASADDRKRAWRNCEKKYMPSLDYEGNEFLDKGTFWFRQGHIFKDPFYYIDYTLAQICAFQFWKKSEETPETAWTDYLALCKKGGSDSFLNLVREANLKSPFEETTIEDIANFVNKHLEDIDDAKF